MSNESAKEGRSRGKACFKQGKIYQQKIVEKLKHLYEYDIQEVEGAKSGPDIIIKNTSKGNIGIEVKNKGAFEGGSAKMFYDTIKNRLSFVDNTLHQSLLGNIVIYDGKNLPYYEGKKTKEDYKQLQHLFSKDVIIEVPTNSMADYYNKTGVYYIQIEGIGLYHTGNDILAFGVPYFECKQKLRIRTSKHKKKGIPTDVVGDINYDKKTLIKSDYDIEHIMKQE